MPKFVSALCCCGECRGSTALHILLSHSSTDKKKKKDWRIKMLTSSNSDNQYSNNLEMTCIHCSTEPLSTIYRATLSNYFPCCFTYLMNAFSHLCCTWSENIPTFTGRNDTISLSLMNGLILWQKRDTILLISCGRCTSEASLGLRADVLFCLALTERHNPEASKWQSW